MGLKRRVEDDTMRGGDHWAVYKGKGHAAGKGVADGEFSERKGPLVRGRSSKWWSHCTRNCIKRKESLGRVRGFQRWLQCIRGIIEGEGRFGRRSWWWWWHCTSERQMPVVRGRSSQRWWHCSRSFVERKGSLTRGRSLQCWWHWSRGLPRQAEVGKLSREADPSASEGGGSKGVFWKVQISRRAGGLAAIDLGCQAVSFWCRCPISGVPGGMETVGAVCEN